MKSRNNSESELTDIETSRNICKCIIEISRENIKDYQSP